MKCPGCGNEIVNNSGYCEHCGYKIDIKEVALPDKQGKRKKVILFSSIGIVLIAAAILIIFLFFDPMKVKKPVTVTDNLFAMNAGEFKNRFNRQLTGDLTGIDDYRVSEAYNMRYYSAQLQNDINITLLGELDSDYIKSVMLEVDLSAAQSSGTFSDYLLCVYHAMDPTATNVENTNYLNIMGDLTGVGSTYSSRFYEDKGIAYKISAKNQKMSLIVLPDYQAAPSEEPGSAPAASEDTSSKPASSSGSPSKADSEASRAPASQKPIDLDTAFFGKLTPKEFVDRFNRMRPEGMEEMVLLKADDKGGSHYDVKETTYSLGESITVRISSAGGCGSFTLSGTDTFSASYLEAFVAACNPLLTSQEITEGVQKALEEGSCTVGGCRVSFIDEERLDAKNEVWEIFIMNFS